MKTNNAIFISIILFFCCSASHAQLKVLSMVKLELVLLLPSTAFWILERQVLPAD